MLPKIFGKRDERRGRTRGWRSWCWPFHNRGGRRLASTVRIAPPLAASWRGAPPRRSRALDRRWDRMGGRHGRHQQADHPGEHAVEADRPRCRRRKPGHRVAVPGRGSGEDPSSQRNGWGSPESHHPFHIHGAGRFLVLARDGAAERNLVWTDTVLIPAGQTVDILLDVTNPGHWMAHCHIAEHHESGMMFSFDVSES